MARYSQLWVEEKQRVADLEKQIEQSKFEISLLRAFINEGRQQEFADWVHRKMCGPIIKIETHPTDTGSVT